MNFYDLFLYDCIDRLIWVYILICLLSNHVRILLLLTFGCIMYVVDSRFIYGIMLITLREIVQIICKNTVNSLNMVIPKIK